MSLRITSSGSFNGTYSFLDEVIKGDLNSRLARYGEEGVAALSAATPHGATGNTASGWGYEIVTEGGNTTIWWTNSNVVNGFPVAVGLQYGHGTGNGGWVEGYDYINPALRPIFDKIAKEVR